MAHPVTVSIPVRNGGVLSVERFSHGGMRNLPMCIVDPPSLLSAPWDN
jgi:hypothetical protein